MQLFVIQRILGLLLMLFSITILTPVPVSIFYQDGAMMPFLVAFLVTLVTGAVFWFPVRGHRSDLRVRDGFVVVVMFWTVLGVFGALPFLLSGQPSISITDSIFESMSGLTTTGATVISGLDTLPRSILFYRQQLQWLGGMGIIVLAVAVLPMLGIGGMQLYRAETPGPMKDNKLTPRITETAKALWYIYLTLTIACGLAYWAAGMNAFDAVAHAFSTVAIGGFSTHDLSMGYFFAEAPLVEVVAIVFMFLSGINFALHFLAWRRHGPRAYFVDTEFKVYAAILLIAAIVTSAYLYWTATFESPGEAALRGVFQAVSIGTTTGFTVAEYHTWPGILPIMLLMMSFIGGCAGSTGGGMKVIRVVMLIKQGAREILRLVHPSAHIPVKVGNKALTDRVMEAVWGFFSLYVVCFCIMSLILVATGLDFVTAFSAVAACMNNLGPGLGDVGSNYTSVNDVAKWVLCFAMLLGRLEIFTLLVLLTPAFWRK
ncbi:potassium transporter [Candidatus Tenderia electrophaga]|jgi:trk system potassium uptake protein TrkH|uniref:Trk system potassium uptake protein n=1 Tax=Candidatus Tenderia electrophaga TaxID=1748243 RepID=A0A0S2TGQ2_9GAMM|nr:potassium transporter [Candidatus Tenderia electrophaga]